MVYRVLLSVDEPFLIAIVAISYLLALPPGCCAALVLDRTRLIARQVAFFNSTGIKIKLRRFTCDVKLETVIAAKLDRMSEGSGSKAGESEP